MLSWPNLKCYVDWKLGDSIHSRRIWSTMWIIKDEIGWYHDLIGGGL
jgi:hypothetical protein